MSDSSLVLDYCAHIKCLYVCVLVAETSAGNLMLKASILLSACNRKIQSLLEEKSESNFNESHLMLVLHVCKLVMGWCYGSATLTWS